MEIVFGSQLDGLVYPETINGKTASYNQLIAGPQSFLGFLESRLGLQRPTTSRVSRVSEYLNLLQNAQGRQFFSVSLESDPWGTSDYLLSIRDELISCGWNKQSIPECGKIGSLAIIETIGAMSTGYGERLQQVIVKLHDCKTTIVSRLSLIEPISLYPLLWQRIFQLLQNNGTAIVLLPQGFCNVLTANAGLSNVETDLICLQKCLEGKNNSTNIQLKNDGSFVVLDAVDEVQAGLFIASWLAQRKNNSDVVLIRGADCSILAQCCKRLGLPSPENTGRSQLKSALQLLPLAFRITFRPADPNAIVEFLSLPHGPIPQTFARYVTDAVAQAPGIDGIAWRAAWQKCIIEKQMWIMEDNPQLSSAEANEKAVEEINEFKTWFVQSVPQNWQTINKVDCQVICKRVEKWATANAVLDRDNNYVFEIAAAQAKLLNQIVSNDCRDDLSLSQLAKMIEAVLKYGVSLSSAEASDWSLVDKPGQIWAEANTVIWWGFAQASLSLPKASVWSKDEISVLASNGINLDELTDKLQRESLGWRAPILNAKSRIILVKPRVVAGEKATPHPLWDELVALIGTDNTDKVTVNAADMFCSETVTFADIDLKSTVQKGIALPKQLRTWKVPHSAIKQRKTESFSSIEKLLGCPLAWVLQYSCGMWQPKGLDLPEKQLLLGKLAHAVINAMFQQKKTWKPAEAKIYAEGALAELIPKIASSLLLPGAKSQLREANEAIPNSVYQLAVFFENANVSVEATEESLSARLDANTLIKGDIDLLVRLPSGQRAVLDFKWSSSPYWYRKKIVEGKALQLAIYSWLAQKTDEKFAEQNVVQFRGGLPTLPPSGFYMFRHAELFFTADGIFPGFTLVRKMLRNLDETWRLTLQSYEREITKLKNGTVIAAGIADDSTELEAFMYEQLAEPPCKFCDFAHFCGKEELV